MPYPIQPEESKVRTFSDAAYNISRHRLYGQSGLISEIYFSDNRDTYHVIDRMSTKQKRVCRSSYGAEILACTNADVGDYYLKSAIRSITPNIPCKHMLLVDSPGLFDTIITLHENNNYCMRQNIQKTQDTFDAGKSVLLGKSLQNNFRRYIHKTQQKKRCDISTGFAKQTALNCLHTISQSYNAQH